MGGSWGHDAKWNVSDRKGQKPHDFTHRSSIKQKRNKQTNNSTRRYRQKICCCQRGRGLQDAKMGKGGPTWWQMETWFLGVSMLQCSQTSNNNVVYLKLTVLLTNFISIKKNGTRNSLKVEDKIAAYFYICIPRTLHHNRCLKCLLNK